MDLTQVRCRVDTAEPVAPAIRTLSHLPQPSSLDRKIHFKPYAVKNPRKGYTSEEVKSALKFCSQRVSHSVGSDSLGPHGV